MHSVRQKRGTTVTDRLLPPLPIPRAPQEEISVDRIVGLPKTPEGYEAIATTGRRLTKMAHFIPTTANITSEPGWHNYLYERLCDYTAFQGPY